MKEQLQHRHKKVRFNFRVHPFLTSINFQKNYEISSVMKCLPVLKLRLLVFYNLGPF